MTDFTKQYEVKEIYENTYSILEKGFEGLDTYMYLLVGDEKALLVDCGFGIIDLKKIVGEITDKPLITVCTHGHHDHVMGVTNLTDCYIHSVDNEVFALNTCEPVLRMFVMNNTLTEHKNCEEFEAFAEEWVSKAYPLPEALDYIPYFDLGNRKIYWHLIPGHTRGSIALYDEKYKAAFDSDGASRGVWIYLVESTSLPEYIETLESYIAFLEEKGVTKRFVAHDPKEHNIEDLRKLLSCCRYALENPGAGEIFRNPYNKARILRHSDTVVIYKEEKN